MNIVCLVRTNRKMLHLIMTLLVHGAYTGSAKCPEFCSCMQTLIYNIPVVTTIERFDGTNLEAANPEEKDSTYKNDLDGIDIIDAQLKVVNNNDTNNFPRIKKCSKNNKDTFRDIFRQNFTAKPVKMSETPISRKLRTKRTLQLPQINQTKVYRDNQYLIQNESKPAAVENSLEKKDVYTYQITCVGLRDLKSVWIRYLPGPATELNIQRTNFQSFKAFQEILKESSTELGQLTVLSVSDSVINQNPDKAESTNKEDPAEEEKHSEFLPFASLQNPKLRSKLEKGAVAYGKCKNLHVLNLTNSTIVYLPRDTFHPFINLQVLNLSNNLIEHIENETFNTLVNLLHLDIHNNRLRSLNEIMFKNLTRLLFLDVSQNLVSSIEPSTFQYLVSLNVLILASNPLSEKQEAVVLLGTGKRLQIVDISNTGLKQIPGTLERSVRNLNLMGNLLLSIRCGDLDSYSLLAYLNLKGNKISYIEDDALGRLEFLKKLQISENNLFQVPKILPNNLEILNLSYNNIQNITKLDFLNLFLLKELFLNYNQITNIEENAFNNLVHLKVLDLSRNPILVLPNIYGRIKLAVLNLSYFTNIPGKYSIRYRQFPVQSPQSVKHLNLESSPLLTKIFLQDTKTLESFTSLEELNLRFTNLTTIRKDIFSLLPQLKVLKVEGNPWHCGREILALSTWLKKHENDEDTEDENEVNTAHCLTPPQLYKVNLITLEEKDLKIGQRKSDNQLISTIRTNSSGVSPNGRLETKSVHKFANVSTKNFSEISPVKKVNSTKYNKTVANVTLIGDKRTGERCENSSEKVNASRKNSVPAYLLPSKRRSTENYSNQTSFDERNFISWSVSSSNSSAEIKNSLDLNSRQVSLKTLKKAEAVTAKDNLSLKKEYNSHLSFLILSFIGLVVMATLTSTSLYFTRTRRDQSYQRQNQDIEVCSISSLGNELW